MRAALIFEAREPFLLHSHRIVGNACSTGIVLDAIEVAAPVAYLVSERGVFVHDAPLERMIIKIIVLILCNNVLLQRQIFVRLELER